MSYKISLILSFIFVVIFFLLAVDMINLQYVYSSLDAKANSVSYVISSHGTIDTQLVNYIEGHYNVSFTCLENCQPKFGDVVEYTISTTFDPMIISTGKMDVTVKRSTVIGYFS